MKEIDLETLTAPGVAALQPYQPGKPLDELEREYGITQAIKLASNENPFGPSPKAITAMQAMMPELARYPDGAGFNLKQALCRKLGLRQEQLTLGNGSNDILELVARAFVTPENEVIFSRHAFAVYPIVTQAVGAKAVITAAKDWGHDLQAMLAAITPRTRLIFIANPNNPTGTWLGRAELEDFLHRVPQHVLVVLDEAYYEYASQAPDAADYPNGMDWLSQHANLIVTRTFSKAYGLAGLRIGYSASHARVADYLNRVRQPFNINSLALAAAEAALTDTEHLENSVAMNFSGREQFMQAFESMNLSYIPTVANFISVKVGDAAKIYESLLHAGVIVRPVANYEMPDYLRITLGTADENERVIAALKDIL